MKLVYSRLFEWKGHKERKEEEREVTRRAEFKGTGTWGSVFRAGNIPVGNLWLTELSPILDPPGGTDRKLSL